MGGADVNAKSPFRNQGTGIFHCESLRNPDAPTYTKRPFYVSRLKVKSSFRQKTASRNKEFSYRCENEFFPLENGGGRRLRKDGLQIKTSHILINRPKDLERETFFIWNNLAEQFREVGIYPLGKGGEIITRTVRLGVILTTDTPDSFF